MTTEITTHRAAQWLASRKPSEVQRELALLVRSHGVSYSARREITFSTLGPNGERIPPREPRFLGYDVSGAVTPELAERIDGFMQPAPINAIEQWLAELSVITAKRIDDDVSEELRLTAYARRLADYPADMVRHVLLDMRWKFFPTWAELGDKLDEMKEMRARLIQSIKENVVRPSEPLATKSERVVEKCDMEQVKAAVAAQKERERALRELAQETLKAMRRNMGIPMKGCVR
jgi:hypothetical protein